MVEEVRPANNHLESARADPTQHGRGLSGHANEIVLQRRAVANVHALEFVESQSCVGTPREIKNNACTFLRATELPDQLERTLRLFSVVATRKHEILKYQKKTMNYSYLSRPHPVRPLQGNKNCFDCVVFNIMFVFGVFNPDHSATNMTARKIMLTKNSRKSIQKYAE